ncbi:MAG: DUF1476 family protein [Rhodospirillales bacterium]|nr:DUF1476 family protein [Rhodospirillales bacterium]
MARKESNRAPREGDQEFEFMAHTRRNKLVGLWAAELLGLIGQAAHDYALDFARRHGQRPGEEDLVQLLHLDLGGKATLTEIRAKLAHLLDEAKRQLHRERKD